HRGQKCYFTHLRQTHNSSMTSREENQRTFNNPQTWGKTPSTYQNNYNQQWHPNMRNHNNSNQNNQMRGPNMDFFPEPEPERKLASDDQADNGESSRNPCRKDVGQHPMTKNRKEPYKILYQNIRRLITENSKKKIEYFKDYVLENKILAMNFTETWLDNLITNDINIKGYQVFRGDRKGRRGGGTAIYLNEDFE
ncbi:unnamed protein product, partial [Meganyctiphanes norvegica]